LTTFLFWNVNRRPVAELIVSLAMHEHVDVLMLAECAVGPGELLVRLNGVGGSQFHLVESLTRLVMVFTRFPQALLKGRATGKRYSIHELRLPASFSVLVMMVHLRSKMYNRDDSQIMESSELSRALRAAEERAGHNRAIVVGDFNMNPFEAGMVGASGFHATMDREVASRVSRTVQGRSYPLFYNPMWNHFGDAGGRVSGTYYYDNDEHKVYFWNMFDQVLIRPELISRLVDPGVRILTESGSTSFLGASGRPNASVASDHLPILFSLDLKGA
jgi:hypothetical protein